MVDRVEERFEVAVHRVAAAFLPAGLHLSHRLMGGTAGAKTITVRAELHLEKRSQHLRDRLLNYTIQSRRGGIGTPNGRLVPSGFGIHARRTGAGR